MNVKRITRLLKLLELLQSGSGQNADGLAKACGVSRRTVFRDIEALRAAGVPVAFDEDHDRYSIPGTYFLPPINFTPAEALSLVALANELGRSDRLPFYEPAHAAARKLEEQLAAGAPRGAAADGAGDSHPADAGQSARRQRGYLSAARRRPGQTPRRPHRIRQPHRMGADHDQAPALPPAVLPP